MKIANIHFIYLSQLINRPVYDNISERKIGYIIDAVGSLEGILPAVKGFIIKTRYNSPRYFLPTSNIVDIKEDKAVYAKEYIELLDINTHLTEKDIFLKETFWDQQIVNISGSKVERVNDLHLLHQDKNLWVVHIDIGFKGFLRRLGWYNFVNNMVKWLFSAEMQDRLIPWKYIQPISTTNMYGSIQLKTSYAKLQTLHPEDLADILLDLGTDDRMTIFETFPVPVAAKTLQELPPRIATQIVESLPIEKLAAIIEELPVDEAVDIIELLSLSTKNELYTKLPQEIIPEFNELLRHSHRVAGSLLNTDYIAAYGNITAGEMLEKLRTEYIEAESIYYIYIIDKFEKLKGVVTLRMLLAANPDDLLEEIMIRNVVSVDIDESIKNVAKVFFKYNFQTLPVVDEYEVLQGVISLKDAFEDVFPEIRKEKEGII